VACDSPVWLLASLTDARAQTGENDTQTKPFKVPAGDVISASVTFAGATDSINGSSLAGGRTYTMNMTSGQTGKQSDYSYTLLPKQTATESVAYFVLEHQPSSCVPKIIKQ